MTPTAFYGTILAAGLAAVVVALLSWQWSEARGRGAELSDDDRTHFARQDLRRWVIAGVMLLLTIGVYLGSTLPYRRNDRPNGLFIAVWLGVFALVLLLVAMAAVDWLATRRYARRHRERIVREGIEILRDEMRVRSEQSARKAASDGSNGHPAE